MTANFVAIDVETANPCFASICQIGLARYIDSSLVEECCIYVDPEDFFSPVNIHIHGIDESVVRGAPTFNELSNELYHWLDNNIVVHHTHFDCAGCSFQYRRGADHDGNGKDQGNSHLKSDGRNKPEHL